MLSSSAIIFRSQSLSQYWEFSLPISTLLILLRIGDVGTYFAIILVYHSTDLYLVIFSLHNYRYLFFLQRNVGHINLGLFFFFLAPFKAENGGETVSDFFFYLLFGIFLFYTRYVRVVSLLNQTSTVFEL